MNKMTKRVLGLILAAVMLVAEGAMVFAAPSDHAFPYEESATETEDGTVIEGIAVNTSYTQKKEEIAVNVKLEVPAISNEMSEATKERLAEAIANGTKLGKVEQDGQTFTGWTVTYVNKKTGKTVTKKVQKITKAILKASDGNISVSAGYKPNQYKISVKADKALGINKSNQTFNDGGQTIFTYDDTMNIDALIEYYSKVTGKEIKGIKLSKNGYTYTKGCGKTIKYNSNTTKVKNLQIILVY